MQLRYERKKKDAYGVDGMLCIISCVVALVFFTASPGFAWELDFAGKPLSVTGYVNQGIAFGIAGEHYDTKDNFQSAVYNVLLELDWRPNPETKVFLSGMLTGDWAYNILSDNREWTEKGFNRSRGKLAHDTDLRDLLQEAHVSWSCGNLLVRAGKQIVSWGETDAFRLMDQINPIDQSRGFTDVEFETTIVPLWLLKTEYYFTPDYSWLQDLGIEFVFNPNADFVPDRMPAPGNNVAGTWAPDLRVPLGGPAPFDYMHLGEIKTDLEEPDDFDSDWFEYGVRIKSVILDTIITLNYFYGIDNSPNTWNAMIPPDVMPSAWDGRMVLSPYMEGKYNRIRLLGATLTRDFENLYISALGGVAPVVRLETFYAFDSHFSRSDYLMTQFTDPTEKFDEFRAAIGIDWKIKVNWLNPRAYFMIGPQFYYRKIKDYPDSLDGYALVSSGGPVEDNNYFTTFMVATTYFHNKIAPMVFWMKDINTHSSFVKCQVVYEYTHNWNYTLGAVFFKGSEQGGGFELFSNKDQLYFTVAYRF